MFAVVFDDIIISHGLLTTRRGRQREVGVENEHGIGVKGF